MSRYRAFPVVLCLFCLTLATTATAEVVIRPHDPAAWERPTSVTKAAFFDKLDEPESTLVVPFYEVDTTNPFGDTTLFAVRNMSNSTETLQLTYFDTEANVLRIDTPDLAARATLSINVRDINGLTADPDGVARGLISVQSTGPLTGDFFQVDLGGAFATGERLFGSVDVCDTHEIRVLDFGDGTDLTLFIGNPQGADADVDPPTATVSVLDETGAILAPMDLFTDQTVLFATGADFTTVDFGTLIFNFNAPSSGWIFGNYSADGLFSVGLNSACTTP